MARHRISAHTKNRIHAVGKKSHMEKEREIRRGEWERKSLAQRLLFHNYKDFSFLRCFPKKKCQTVSVQWIVLMFNNIPIVQLMKHLTKQTLSRQKRRFHEMSPETSNVNTRLQFIKKSSNN